MPNKYKEIKKYLNRAYKYTKVKEALEREYEQEIDSLRDDEIKGKGIKVENKTIKLIGIKKDIELYNIKLISIKKDIAYIINKLQDEILKKLLSLRYLKFKKWEDIAHILNYSHKYVFKLHNKCLIEIAQYIDFKVIKKV